ncbi:MAG: YccF domain-containing protein [Bacteroidales bacterium]|nr:YccF domain-containing protein [Bacteroidales bacterium]
MSILGNIIWFILGGFIMGALYILGGLLFCITIIGIPFGLQLMKIGLLSMMPFGSKVVLGEGEMGCLSLVLNVIWILCGGIELAIMHLIIGAIFCITIIGIPFGMQHFKLAKLAVLPFGQLATTKN